MQAWWTVHGSWKTVALFYRLYDLVIAKQTDTFIWTVCTILTSNLFLRAVSLTPDLLGTQRLKADWKYLKWGALGNYFGVIDSSFTCRNATTALISRGPVEATFDHSFKKNEESLWKYNSKLFTLFSWCNLRFVSYGNIWFIWDPMICWTMVLTFECEHSQF